MSDSYERHMAELRAERDAYRDRIAALEARCQELEAALQRIVKLGPLTLIGGDDMSGVREAYSVGAHRAFEQAAEFAASALETKGEQ